ncbi:MAG: hypothetical protein HOM41_06770 [Flavobacteriales bacterium]|jgi:hypothetical protein|nr:hypothetical protein [Flavobacteriales bacterium]
MRYLLTLLLAALSLNAFSQNNAIHVYPWNPDANQDNEIGMGDLLSFLSVFGNEFGLPPEPCTYDGTPLEELMTGITDGTIILDSLFIEYELEDISTFYLAGCPEPITDTLVFVNSGMLYQDLSYSEYWRAQGNDAYSKEIRFRFYFNSADGLYHVQFGSYALDNLGFTNDGYFDNMWAYTPEVSIPFPASWVMNEDGIELEWSSGWAIYANYLHILPYWHYADE